MPQPDNIKYFHCRYLNIEGELQGKGGETCAYIFTPDDASADATDVNVKGKVVYATAYCHQADNFCRATGRLKAAKRLQSYRYHEYFEGTQKTFYDWFQQEFRNQMIEEMVESAERDYEYALEMLADAEQRLAILKDNCEG